MSVDENIQITQRTNHPKRVYKTQITQRETALSM